MLKRVCKMQVIQEPTLTFTQALWKHNLHTIKFTIVSVRFNNTFAQLYTELHNHCHKPIFSFPLPRTLRLYPSAGSPPSPPPQPQATTQLLSVSKCAIVDIFYPWSHLTHHLCMWLLSLRRLFLRSIHTELIGVLFLQIVEQCFITWTCDVSVLQ